jgi:hypothetical protein
MSTPSVKSGVTRLSKPRFAVARPPLTDGNRQIRANAGEIEISFPYDEKIVAAVRDIPGRRWIRGQKVWTCPLESLPEAIEILEPVGFRISKKLKRLAEDALKARSLREEALRAAEERLSVAAQQKCIAQEAVRRAEEAMRRFRGERAFVPAGDAGLTRAIKKGDKYRSIIEQTDFGDSIIGYELPESALRKTLLERKRPTDPATRLLTLLRQLFEINSEAKSYRSWHSTAVTRYGKKDHMLREACRLAAKQDCFVWGWKVDPDPPPNGADWVLYFEKDGKQLSFHTFARGAGPDFPGEWDGQHNLAFPW